MQKVSFIIAIFNYKLEKINIKFSNMIDTYYYFRYLYKFFKANDIFLFASLNLLLFL